MVSQFRDTRIGDIFICKGELFLHTDTATHYGRRYECTAVCLTDSMYHYMGQMVAIELDARVTVRQREIIVSGGRRVDWWELGDDIVSEECGDE